MLKTAIAAILLMAVSNIAHAVEWRLGVAYASGLSDVTDLYEENLRLAGFDANVDLKFPVGVAAGLTYDWGTGVRADLGLGPLFLIGGDVEHLEVPLSVTVGYSFLRLSHASPYVRAGVVHHFVSGDLYSSSSPGLFAAAGVDFTHFTFEVSVDQSEVKFDSLSCTDGAASGCRLTTTGLHTYDFLAGLYWRFR